MAEKPNTPSRRTMLAGLAAAPVAALPAIAGVVADDDPIFAAFAEHERARAVQEAIYDAADDLRSNTSAAIKAAGLDPRGILTRRQLETWREMRLCSEAYYEAGLTELDGPPSEYQKMLMRVEELEDADLEAGQVAGETERVLYETAPTTHVGALRLLRFIADFLDEDDVVNDLYVGDVVGGAIRNAIAVFERDTLA